MFNLAAASDSRQRHVNEMKVKLDTTERKAGLRERDFNRQEEILQNLQSEKNRVDSEARALCMRVSSLENQLRIAKDKNVEKSKKIIILEMDREGALERVQLRRQEVERLKSAEHMEKIIADFMESREYEAEIKVQAITFFDKGVIYAIRQLHHLEPEKKSLVDVHDNNFDAEAC